MIKTFKYKLYSSKKNKKIHNSINLACWIYNHCITLHKRYYSKYKKYLNLYQLQKHITKLKKLKKYSRWKNLDAQAVQDITERIDRAYKLFFKHLNKKVRPPSFKSKYKYKSFTLKQNGYKLINNKLKIGKANYKLSLSRRLEGTIKTVTLKRDLLGDIYIFFVCKTDQPKKKRIMTGETAGFDFGLKTYLVSSDEEKIKSPLFFKRGLKKIRKAARNLSRRQKKSNNRKRARKNLFRVYKKISNQRTDFHFKLARELTSRYDELYFETLNIKAMQMLWGRKVSDLGFSAFMNILEYYCEKEGVEFIKISRWEATSKTCHVCGWRKEDLTLEDREWVCEVCGTKHDRDINAAKNIKAVGASAVRVEGSKTYNFSYSLKKKDYKRPLLILESD